MASKRSIDSYSAYLFDVDGTLIYPGGLVPGAPEALSVLKSHGKSVHAVTNNSTSRQEQLASRFRELGLPIEDHKKNTTHVATARHVAHEQPGARVYVLGNPGLRAEVEHVGLVPDDTADAEYVVVGNCWDVTYPKLTIAMRALMNGARFVAVNADRHYVGPDGGLVPGAGLLVSGLERAVGRGPDVVVGKPSITILVDAAESVGQPQSSCLYIGDNPEADVAGAHAAGMDALLVLTGVATEGGEWSETPEHVLASVADLAAYFGL